MVEAQQAEIRRLRAYSEGARDLIDLIRPLHKARSSAAAQKRTDETYSRDLRAFLRNQPEGERELWDNDGADPVGVRLEDGGGSRWCDLSGLSDEVVLWAARHGCLQLLPAGLDAMATLAPTLAKEDRDTLSLFNAAVHAGGGERLVLLPKRGE